MMTIPGCVGALKVVAAGLPAASFLFNFARGFNTRLRACLKPKRPAGRFQPPPFIRTPAFAPGTRFDCFIISLDLDSRLW
jgi:hypothetical protein